MNNSCTWPNGHCLHWAESQSKPDPFGRVWMHCEQGLSMSNASLARFLSFCLKNNVKIGDMHALNPRYPRSHVTASVLLKPSQFEAFEKETGGKLSQPATFAI